MKASVIVLGLLTTSCAMVKLGFRKGASSDDSGGVQPLPLPDSTRLFYCGGKADLYPLSVDVTLTLDGDWRELDITWTTGDGFLAEEVGSTASEGPLWEVAGAEEGWPLANPMVFRMSHAMRSFTGLKDSSDYTATIQRGVTQGSLRVSFDRGGEDHIATAWCVEDGK